MFSISSKYAASSIRPYIVPLSGRRLVVVSCRCSNFSSSAEGDNNLQQDDRRPSPDSTLPINDQDEEHHGRRRSRKTLTVESLGKPGKILVLPHTKRRKLKIVQQKTKENLNEASTKEDISFLSVDDLAAKGRNAAAGVSYTALLDEIRSTHSPGEILSAEEWEKLRTKIKQGFTQRQLSKYASRFSQSSLPLPKHESDAEIGDENENYKWRAGVSPSKATLENARSASRKTSKAPRTGDKAGKGQIGKDIFAERILRDCWQLETYDTVGQLSIPLPSQVISLILSSHESWINLMSESYGVKIEIDEPSDVIHVHGTRHACEQVRDSVQTYSSTVCTEPIDLPFLKKLPADKDNKTRTNFLQWIGQSYGTFIRDQGRSSMASVSYFENNKNNFNKARRELEFANFVTASKPVPFCSYVLADTPGFMKFASPKRVAVLSRLDREKSWARWSIPVIGGDFVRDSAPPLFKKHSPNLSSEILQVLKENASHSHQPDVEEKLTAAVGQCLFEKCADDNLTILSASKLGELSIPRLWHGWLPKARPFVEVLRRFPGEKRFGNSHQFRMIPCNQNDNALPILEVELFYPWTKNEPDRIPFNEAELKSVKAVVEETSVDYLLPECNHDLRFTRTLTRNILGAPTHEDSNPLRMAILYPLEEMINQPQEPLPLTCEVPIPRFLLRNSSVKGAQNTSNAFETEAGGDTIVGKYWFPGVQSFLGTLFRSYDFLGEKLNFCHTHGGPLDTHRDDLVSLQMLVDREAHSSLPPIPPNVQDANTNPAETALEQEFRSFYRTSCQLAFSLSQYSRKRKY